MTTAPDLIDPFHRALYARLSVEIQSRMEELANGSCTTIMGDTATVAEKYAAQTNYIRALKEVLEVCEELERERYGERGGREPD